MSRLIEKINQLSKNQRLKLLELLQAQESNTHNTVVEKIAPSENERFNPPSFEEKFEQKRCPKQDDYLLTEQWGKGEFLDVPDTNLYELFTESAKRFLDKTAVSMNGRSISYQELIDQAEQLSATLNQKYSPPAQANIAIYLPRSIEMIVAILAVLRLGCVFVPIDISQPADRSKKIIDDANPTIVITHSLVKKTPDVAVSKFVLDKEKLIPSTKILPKKALPTDLAYIIYTSGTTGTPKGVMIEHRSVINFTLSMLRLFEITYLDRILFFASVGFDVAIFEIFTSLISGAELIIANDEERISPILLGQLLRREKITVAEIPPVVLPMLNHDDFPNLRLLSVGGEKFSEDIIRSWLNPNRRVINGYGPTETTVAVTIYDYRGKQEYIPAIGRPTHNHCAYLIDKNKKLAPIGSVGELCISGVGLARGYYKQAVLTEEKFTFLALNGKQIRVFKTGDLARWRHDGNLEFVGRIDRQIKFKGYRIEPGEIESILLSHPKIKHAIINYEKRQTSQPGLVAYLVAKDQSLTVKEIILWLAEKLPAYMLPVYVAFINKIPLTTHGKVDYNALTKESILATMMEEDLTRFNDTQLIIQNIFKKYLGGGPIGLEDNFFYMGGDSLSSAHVVNDISAAFGYPLKMMNFLCAPTIHDLAKIVNKKNHKKPNQKTFERILITLKSPWLTMKENKKASKYLIYFHCAGGSCAQIIRWKNILSPSIQLIGIQLPGHDQRLQEQAVDDIEKLASMIAPELEDLFEKPVYLMGHSMGALLAYAVCQQLVKKKLYPKALIAVASRSPQNLPKKNFSDISSDQFFLKSIYDMGGLSQEFLANNDLIDILLPALRSDTKASETFFCGEKIPVPIVAISGKKDSVCELEDVMRWAEVTSGKFQSYSFDGGHFFIQEHENSFIQCLNDLLV